MTPDKIAIRLIGLVLSNSCLSAKIIELSNLFTLKFVSALAVTFMGLVQYNSGPYIGIWCKNMTTGSDVPYYRLRTIFTQVRQ